MKWILAVGGFFLFKGSFLGAIFGFIVGSFIENYQRVMGNAKANAHREGRSFNAEDIFQYYQQQSLLMMFRRC